MNPAQLWSEKYAARFEALRALETQLRAEAFVDAPMLICGEPVSLMTPHHLHLLEGIGNPLVCGGAPSAAHFAQFLWLLSPEHARGGWLDGWRYGRFIRRIARLDAESVRDACTAYLEMVFLDAGRPTTEVDRANAEKRPFGGWFLVPLLARLTNQFGARDPYSGRAWGHVPLPVIFQFRKAADVMESGGKYTDRNPSDKLLSDYAAELGQLTAAS